MVIHTNAITKNSTALMKYQDPDEALTNIPPDTPHSINTTTMIDLGAYELPCNADHIYRAADDPYHSLYVKLMYQVFEIKRRLLKALRRRLHALTRKIEALTMLGRQRFLPMFLV